MSEAPKGSVTPMLLGQLQQMWLAAVAVGQQAVALELSGNAAAAAQAYAQCAEQFRIYAMLASSNGVFVQGSVHATHATAHMGAARAKTVMGAVLDASPHFQLALAAIRAALASNPHVPAWHSAAGAILFALGDLTGASAEFEAVQTALPGEPHSRAMLEQLAAVREATTGWGVLLGPAALGFGPGAAMASAPGLGSATSRDWGKAVRDVFGAFDAVMGAMGKFQDLARPFGNGGRKP